MVRVTGGRLLPPDFGRHAGRPHRAGSAPARIDEFPDEVSHGSIETLELTRKQLLSSGLLSCHPRSSNPGCDGRISNCDGHSNPCRHRSAASNRFSAETRRRYRYDGRSIGFDRVAPSRALERPTLGTGDVGHKPSNDILNFDRVVTAGGSTVFMRDNELLMVALPLHRWPL
ncbi:hypothetical protein NJ7G_0381 [Natrinema sp. J7-2]|nr:hypothetical protein NJ7G_0381 [Natrinema sp. J7-2]